VLERVSFDALEHSTRKGSGWHPRSVNRLRVAAAALAASMVVLLPAAPSQAAGITSIAQLRNAPIPASCRHQATTLDGYGKSFGMNGDAQLVTGAARFGHLRGVAGSVAAVPLSCNAGGVGWPELVLLYGAGKHLLGYVDLAKLPTAQEHEDLVRLRFGKGRIQVRWQGYEGAGSTFTTYRGVIGWKKGHRTWSHTGPMTIDYAKDRSSYDFGPGIVGSASDARVWLYPAPTAFRTFIRHRWQRVEATNPESICGFHGYVTVDRYSHKGFASGGEGGCGGVAFVWGRVHGTWRVVVGYQDLPSCTSLTKIQRRAFVALAQSCMTKSGGSRHLGHWPSSGQ